MCAGVGLLLKVCVCMYVSFFVCVDKCVCPYSRVCVGVWACLCVCTCVYVPESGKFVVQRLGLASVCVNVFVRIKKISSPETMFRIM